MCNKLGEQKYSGCWMKTIEKLFLRASQVPWGAESGTVISGRSAVVVVVGQIVRGGWGMSYYSLTSFG